MKQERKKYTAKFKADVALAAIKGQLTTAQIAEQYKVSSNMIYKWRRPSSRMRRPYSMWRTKMMRKTARLTIYIAR